MSSAERISIDIWRADVVVLFNWLASVDLEAIPITHRAEKQALMDLLTQIEWVLEPPSREQIADAREAVSRDMGW